VGVRDAEGTPLPEPPGEELKEGVGVIEEEGDSLAGTWGEGEALEVLTEESVDEPEGEELDESTEIGVSEEEGVARAEGVAESVPLKYTLPQFGGPALQQW